MQSWTLLVLFILYLHLQLCFSYLSLPALPNPSFPLLLSVCTQRPDFGLWPLLGSGLSLRLSWFLLPPLGHPPARHSCSQAGGQAG